MSKVLLVGARSSRMSLLNRALLEFDYEVVARVEKSNNLTHLVQEFSPDVLVIGVEVPDSETLSALAELHKCNPITVVMFVENGSNNIIHKAIKAGVNAYIVADLQPQRLKTIIDVAIARFNEFQALRTELDETRTKLEDRKLVDRAKGLLMSRQGISEDEAYQKLRRMAMDKGETLANVARNIIDVMELLEADS